MFAHVAPEHDVSQLRVEFLECQKHNLKKMVEPSFARGYMYRTGTSFHIVLDPLAVPKSSANAERSFSISRVISRQRCDAVTD